MVSRPVNRGVIITDTATYTGQYAKFVALSATVIASISSNSLVPSPKTALAVPANGVVEGDITSIQLTSGTGILYEYP